MRLLVYVCVVAAAGAVYTDMDENIDTDAVVADPDRVKPFLDCYLDKGPCTDKAQAFKRHIAEIISTSCQKCDDKLKHMTEEFFFNVMTLFPKEFAQLRAKYDPGNKLHDLVLVVSKY